MIAVVKAILFCMKMPGVHVQRPNPSMDDFSRLILDLFWNHGSSGKDPKFEPIVDAFIKQYMAIEERASEDDPTHPELHPKARMFDTKLILERLAGQFTNQMTGNHRRLRRGVVLLPNIIMKQFHVSLRTNKTYERCCGRNHDTHEDETVGILDVSVFNYNGEMTVQSVIQWYLSTEFPINPIQCISCKKHLDGVQTFKVTNTPEFLPVSINRSQERIQIGDTLEVNQQRYENIAAVHHCGSENEGHYS